MYTIDYKIIYEDWQLLTALPGFYIPEDDCDYLPCTVDINTLPNKFSIFGYLSILGSHSARISEREQFMKFIEETEIKYKIKINEVQNIYCSDLFRTDFLKSINLPTYKKHIISDEFDTPVICKVQLEIQTFEDNELVGLIVKGEKI